MGLDGQLSNWSIFKKFGSQGWIQKKKKEKNLTDLQLLNSSVSGRRKLVQVD